jgi:hypothetical protein
MMDTMGKQWAIYTAFGGSIFSDLDLRVWKMAKNPKSDLKMGIFRTKDSLFASYSKED